MAEKSQVVAEQESDDQSATVVGQVEAHHPHLYDGSGTVEDPFVVEFIANDPHNPMNFSFARKWFITFTVTLSVFAITLTSSAYSGSAEEIIAEFNSSSEVYALGISLFVLGFAIGPALWAPLSELYGRQILFITTHGFVVAFVAASAGCHSMASLLVFRFLAGMFGASPLTNSGGVLADLFPPASRGIAMSIFAAAPFMGPVMGYIYFLSLMKISSENRALETHLQGDPALSGKFSAPRNPLKVHANIIASPIIGGFITMDVGWRWVQAVCCIFIGVVWIVGSFALPETYGPVLLRKRAKHLSQKTGKVYKSVLEVNTGGVELSEVFGKALKRPWILLFREPIVLIASTYLAIIYGTIYMFMGAFPIVYQQDRHWNAGIGGLAFLGLAAGMLVGLVYTIMDNSRYKNLGKSAVPESRLPPCMIGALALPIGMFAFAWTNYPSIHWSASIILSSPFGFGSVLVFMSCLNYLMDSYTIYAASVLAAGAILRSLFGAAFPLFTTYMFKNLGIHWAASVPAFLTVACLPFPFVMYKYGGMVRMKCKYAKEAAILLARMQLQAPGMANEEEEESA